MTDESQLKIERGYQANALLESSIFKECMAKLEARYIEAWKAATTVDLREDAHKYVRLLEWLAADIQEIATTGALTQQRLDLLQGKPISLKEYDAKWRTM